MADLLDRTARQVRGVRGPIHMLAGIDQHPAARVYHARCGDVLSNTGGAVLTTRHATCLLCAPAGKGNATASGSPGRDGGRAMRSWIRWRIATLVGRLDGQCWADLVSWALDGRGKRRQYNRLPWQPRTPMCTQDAVRNGRCYCGKLGRDGSIGGGR